LQPPLDNSALRNNRLLLRRLATRLRLLEGNLLVVGDFNATPYSSFYENFVDWVSLENSMSGFGYWRTWNALNNFERFSIDHVLMRGDLKILDFRRKSSFGSDHFPLVVTFGR
ncbi:MAG: hypothetical protein KDD42_07470, partial [Bdellovibrionales bacterium]|nr:hypothetical protein [Bdellovibrionales bacterium]